MADAGSALLDRDDMIDLLGKRPFEKHDPYDEAMLGGGTPSPLPVNKPKQSPKTQKEAQGAKQGEPGVLPDGIEGGEGVPVPEPRGIEAGVATASSKL